MSDRMMKDEVAVALRKLLKDEEYLERDERFLIKQAADLLGSSMFALLSTAYKTGCLDGLMKGGYGSNKHVVARQMGEAYALKIINGGTPS